MSVSLHHQVDVHIHRSGTTNRRDFLRLISAGGIAAGTLSWSDLMMLKADQLRRRGKACILLWMQGGPSQFETFAPKPAHANGGQTKAIPTSVPGIQIAQNLPYAAKGMDDICVIRSVTSREGSHPRASYLLHTGYLPTANVKYPTLGSHVAHQLGDPQSDLPGFVRIGRFRSAAGGGLLGVDYDPFVVSKAGSVPDNASLPTSQNRFRRRLQLLDRLEEQFESTGAQQEVADHRKLYDQASRMVLSPRMETFDLNREPAAVRQAYGSSQFAAGCLLARRLVEAGVTFVEVNAGNWDTHQDNFQRTAQLCEQIDQPYAQLLSDLKQRGMLDTTLVIWMGEFGRTPRVNPRAGRDHYPRAFSIALAGGGVQGGQVIGATDEGGVSVSQRPVGVPDLFRTLFHSLSIDPDQENMSGIGRPIKLVEGGETVKEVFGSSG